MLQLLFVAGLLIATVSTLFTAAMAANITHKTENAPVTKFVTITRNEVSNADAPAADPKPLNITTPEPLNLTTAEPLNISAPEPLKDEPPSAIAALSTTSDGYYKIWENWGSRSWADAEKLLWNFDDDDLCWAATSSNILEWTGWGLVGGWDECDDIFAVYQHFFTDDYGNVYDGLHWWFDGTEPDDGAQVELPGWGGAWAHLPWYMNYHTYIDTDDDLPGLLPAIEDFLRRGYAVGLSIAEAGKTSGHAITCWGVDFNPAYPTSDHRRYEGIWVTDSDDNKDNPVRADPRNEKNRLRYYTVGYSTANSRWDFTGPGWFDYGGWLGGDWYIRKVYALAAGPGIPPKAHAGPDQTVYEGDRVSFSGSCESPGPTLPSDKYSWHFGDPSGTQATGKAPSHTYSAEGTYHVTLTVEDYQADEGRDTLSVTVLDSSPTAAFAWSPESLEEGSMIQFTDLSTSPGDEIVAWAWTFDDGATSTAQNPTHIYADDGEYNVSLMVTDEDGSTDNITILLTVLNVAPTVCIASADQPYPFTLAEWIVLMRDPVFVTGTASDPGSDDLTFSWSGDDGIEYSTVYLNEPPTYPVAIEEILEHTYMEPGDYLLNLTVTDDDGGIGKATVTLTVWGPRDLKTNVIAELEALRTGEKCVDRSLNRTIRCIQGSLNELLWLDATHLDAYWGWCVFLYEHLAEVHLELRSELYDYLIPVLEEWIAALQAKGCDTTWLEAKLARMQALLPVFEAALFKLAKADELLVRVAIADAENTPVENAKWQHKVDAFLLKANQHLMNATDCLAMERFGTAICHYKVAWMFAQKAMQWATESYPPHCGWGCWGKESHSHHGWGC
jgi:PKD repeat protein